MFFNLRAYQGAAMLPLLLFYQHLLQYEEKEGGNAPPPPCFLFRSACCNRKKIGGAAMAPLVSLHTFSSLAQFCKKPWNDVIGTNVRVISPWPEPATKVINNKCSKVKMHFLVLFPNGASKATYRLGNSYLRYVCHFAELRYPARPPIKCDIEFSKNVKDFKRLNLFRGWMSKHHRDKCPYMSCGSPLLLL
jgi:hypothetical protein